MSVSFFASLDGDVVIPSFAECGCGSFCSQTFASRAEAQQAIQSGLVVSTCADDYCVAYGNLWVSDNEPAVNLSNDNADEMLNNLGILVDTAFSERCAGSLSAEDFKGRVLMALALLPTDEGMPAYRISEEGAEGAQMWQGARPAGYSQDKLNNLLEVAEYALAQGREVVWA